MPYSIGGFHGLACTFFTGPLVLFHGLAFRFNGMSEFTRRWKLRACIAVNRKINRYNWPAPPFHSNFQTRWDVEKCQNLTFKNQYSMSKINRFFFWYQFRQRVFVKVGFDSFIFDMLYFLKWCPIFYDSPPHQFKKYKNLIEDIESWLKIYLFLYPSLENSTTHVTYLGSYNEINHEISTEIYGQCVL